MLGGVTLLTHPLVRRRFASPVPPGTGWPDDPASAYDPGRARPRTTYAGWPRPTTSASSTPGSVVCSACPRLVAWREQVADQKRASFADQPYWGRPIAGWGDEHPSVLIVGLAPAANGGNRTGRVFTGDSSGDWLFASLHRVGLAAQPTSASTRGTGSGCSAPGWSRPCGARRRSTSRRRSSGTPASRGSARRSRWSADSLRVVVALGGFGWTGALDALAAAGYVVPRPRPKFGHGASVVLAGPDGRSVTLLGCYHPSQQNTFTGRLTDRHARRRPRPRRVVTAPDVIRSGRPGDHFV